MLTAAALLWGSGTHGATTPDSATPAEWRAPNIIVILADDLGIGDTGVYGSRVIQTPNIDRLAQQGVLFSQAYVTHPVCSPSRAGLMTGRYQQRHGWEFNPAGRDAKHGMRRDQMTLANLLKRADYTTGIIGKWHLGQQTAYHPLARGFDEFFGVLAGAALFIDPEMPGVQSLGLAELERMAQIPIFRQRQRVKEATYLTDAFTREAVDFIQRHRRTPFFLYLSHTAPHTPLQATAAYLQRYAHIEDDATRIYAAMVAALDASVGAVVNALEETAQRANTLIVFTSDNGCAGYLRGACSNAPYSGFKRFHQEGGIRIPMIMNWPAGLPSGAEYAHPVSTLDLWSTFAAAAGRRNTTEDSVNLLPYLNGDTQGMPHEYLYWRSGPTLAIRDHRWKLIRYNRLPRTQANNDAAMRLTPPPGGWPGGSPHGQVTLLYDLEADPAEAVNLASKHPQVVARLLAQHGKWAARLTAPMLPAIRSSSAAMDGETVQLFF